MSIETEGPELCNWTEDEDGNWSTDCGNAFVLNDGTPIENKMKFCCFCGDQLVEVRFGYDDEEENEPGDAMIKERNKG